MQGAKQVSNLDGSLGCTRFIHGAFFVQSDKAMNSAIASLDACEATPGKFHRRQPAGGDIVRGLGNRWNFLHPVILNCRP
jgi:hypothetical protein